MTEALQETIETFESVDPAIRLDLLLDYARSLPPLPQSLHEARDQGLGRVTECQSPVFLYPQVQDGAVHIDAFVPSEAPTARGLVSLLAQTLEGATPEQVAAVPDDLLYRLGLAQQLGMMRQQGLAATIARLKHGVAEAAG